MPPTAESARDWAEAGLDELWDDLQREKFPMPRDEVGIWLRAAYGRGYTDALSEPEPAIITEALEHSTILQVLVPIS